MGLKFVFAMVTKVRLLMLSVPETLSASSRGFLTFTVSKLGLISLCHKRYLSLARSDI